MMQNTDTPGATRKGDRRVTLIGGYLRDWKLDELPQLFNVLRGELSLVGPRPNLPRYWKQLPPELQCALAVKPGVTSLATLEFRDEEDVLNAVAPENLDQFYLAEIFPAKVATDLRYAEQATLLSDLKILLRTVSAVFKLNGIVRATARART
jgi:lipopolysaccharide/colanic/teichoic acid biosynthesis glycosyltransferase